jgi:type II secretory pathway pseudopilin PulG
VELLVVITIIGILIALLLPAVQAAREAARRGQCTNNMKQIALGLHNYCNNWNCFPRYGFAFTTSPSLCSWVGNNINNRGQWEGRGAFVALLPFIDQQVIYDKWNFSFSWDAACSGDSSNSQDVTIGQNTTGNLRVPGFRCPSDAATMPNTNWPGCNYCVSEGPTVGWCNNGAWEQIGMFSCDFETTPADITDGLSNTYMLSEQRMGNNVGTGTTAGNFTPADMVHATAYPTGWTYTFVPQDLLTQYGQSCQSNITGTGYYTHTGAIWAASMHSQSVYNSLAPPNWSWPTCDTCVGCGWMDSDGVFPARSQHAGGVNTAMGDASVTFIGNSIDFNLNQALGSKSGGEAVSVP